MLLCLENWWGCCCVKVWRTPLACLIITKGFPPSFRPSSNNTMALGTGWNIFWQLFDLSCRTRPDAKSELKNAPSSWTSLTLQTDKETSHQLWQRHSANNSVQISFISNPGRWELVVMSCMSFWAANEPRSDAGGYISCWCNFPPPINNPSSLTEKKKEKITSHKLLITAGREDQEKKGK